MTRCGLCGLPLDVSSDSPDFCSEQHQRQWHLRQQLIRDLNAIGQAIARDLTAAFAQLAAQLRPFVDALEHAGVLRKQLPADVQARALELRRTRNTGPAQPQRPPRRIDPRRTR